MTAILIAEDDELTRNLLRDTLLAEGYTVSTVSNGREAIQAIAFEPPQILVLDLVMPGLSGSDVLKTIRTTPEIAKIHVIILTGAPEPESLPDLMTADLVLRKPIPIDELIQHIKTYTAQI